MLTRAGVASHMLTLGNFSLVHIPSQVRDVVGGEAGVPQGSPASSLLFYL